MKTALFEQTLREVEVTPDFLYDWLFQYFKRELNIDRKLLPRNFIKTMVTTVVRRLLKYDKMFANDQGFILIPSEGAKLRRGATHLQIRTFIDVVVQVCSTAANKMTTIPEEKLQLFEKTFIQTFSDESANKGWKLALAKLLTDKIAESKPFYIEIPYQRSL